MGKRKAKSNDELESTNESNELTTYNEKRGKYEKPLLNTGKGNNKHDTEFRKGNDGTLKQDSMEKLNWSEFRKQKKELREKFKAKRFSNIYNILVTVKQIGEKLRRSDCSEKKRAKLISKAHNLLTNNYSRVVLTHDMSRIIQWMFKYSDSKIQQDIFKELQPLLLSMIESKYAKSCIKIMLKHGSPEMRSNIVSSCYGNVVRLMSHSVSVPILEIIYSKWSTDEEKICLKQEFYGDMYKMAKDKNVKTLSDVFKTAKDMKSATLTAVKGNLMRILNKGLLHCPLVHCVLFEFLNNCSNEDRTEMIVMLRNFILELSESKIGAKVAVICIWNGTNKDRKIIMKCLKENVKNVSMSEHGYIILLALFDSVDDTVLLNKLILSEIQTELTEIALNEYGKHVILYLVARRDSHHFPPLIVKYLEQGDNNATSKKPANIREKELLDSICDSLLEAIITNTADWMSNSSIVMVTLAILKVGTGEKLTKAFNSIAAFITDEKSKIEEKGSEYKPIEHSGIHMMLKKLIQNDKELQKKGESTFGETLIDHLENKTIEEWIKYNRACFVLILLLENEAPSTVNTLVSKLRPIMYILESKSHAGAKILLQKLQ
ncbi:pumilio and CPL domain-containing protein penguin [Megachile rotundata]|uniref:pumilio and CPL domain-containing protein penguin n=1 Tax=Megachile rotundata TaxID=143995 RepID=UPI000614BE58|nr:PREDICTED: pumilio domain-containing protein KIAA0020 [Megachile rotundata]